VRTLSNPEISRDTIKIWSQDVLKFLNESLTI